MANGKSASPRSLPNLIYWELSCFYANPNSTAIVASPSFICVLCYNSYGGHPFQCIHASSMLWKGVNHVKANVHDTATTNVSLFTQALTFRKQGPRATCTDQYDKTAFHSSNCPKFVRSNLKDHEDATDQLRPYLLSGWHRPENLQRPPGPNGYLQIMRRGHIVDQGLKECFLFSAQRY